MHEVISYLDVHDSCKKRLKLKMVKLGINDHCLYGK